MTRLLTLLLALCLACIPGAWAQELDASKRANIEQLLEVTRALENAKALMPVVARQQTEAYARRFPQIKPEHLELLVQAYESVFIENLSIYRELMVHLYHRHFSADDIQQLLAFYDSPAGKKMIQATPALNKEGFEIGMQFGQILGPKVDQRVRERLAARGISL
jgi:hypothetical protein